MVEQSFGFEQYLDALPVERRNEIERVWSVMRESVPADYTEHVGAKFLTLRADDEDAVVLANQKNYISLYLMPVYIFPELKAKLDAAAVSKKIKCGKSCINFTRADDLPLAAIAEILSSCPNAASYKAHMTHVRAAGK